MNCLETGSLCATLAKNAEGYKETDGGSRKKLPAEQPPSLYLKCKNSTHSFALAAAPAVPSLPTPFKAQITTLSDCNEATET